MYWVNIIICRIKEMEAFYQFPAQNNQLFQKSRSYRHSVERKAKRCASVPLKTRALLIIDGAYFEQGTASYMNTKYGINLFDTSTPEFLLQCFVSTIEEELDVTCIHRHFITSLFDNTRKHRDLRDTQDAMIDALEKQ